MAILMLDVQGYELSPEDRDVLEHPLTGGVIFFSRNYHDPSQVKELSRQVRQAAGKPILIAVDQEGGRVQRFKEQFSRIPAMGNIIEQCQGNLAQAKVYCRAFGELMAIEVQAVDIDISFAPVVDINHISEVIGDRGFSTDKSEVVTLAEAFIQGMKAGGMATTGKHFPGHGSVREDSHIALPVDRRPGEQIFAEDFWVFEQLINNNMLDAVMPAHVIYAELDPQPAGFSDFWINEMLRKRLQFDGVVFSDDLSMEGAMVAGDPVERAELAMGAGCDMALICNHREAAIAVLDGYKGPAKLSPRVQKMIMQAAQYPSLKDCCNSPKWQTLNQTLAQFREC